MTSTTATSTRPPSRPVDTRGGAAHVAAPLLAWCLFALVLVSRIYRSMLFTLVAIAMLPIFSDWSGFVVRTGSMQPALGIGDVVIAQPFDPSQKVPIGRVMIFQAPAGSGAGATVRIHRVVARAGPDTYTTAGDANPSNDAVPVPRANFRSRAIIRVPFVGRPLVWLDEGNYLTLVLWLAMTAFLIHLSFRPVDGSHRDTPRGPRRRPRRGVRRTAHQSNILDRPWPVRLSQHSLQRRVRGTVRVAFALGILGAVFLIPEPAMAAFTATTVTGPNLWTASATLRQPYTAAVAADSPYAFYLLDESSGASAADRSGNSRTGTYTSLSAYRQPGALTNNFGFAIALAANSGRMVTGGTGLSDPTTFSVEMWFKTTTAAGGKLIGFENSQNATSTSYDREAFMRTDGKIVYMGATSTSKLLVSPTALNNGAWHHLVITSIPSGSQETSVMYVDGAQVATGNTSKAASSYTGWWRVGFGKVPTGSGYPSTGNFTGSVDNVAIYTTQLTAARVTAHFTSR